MQPRTQKDDCECCEKKDVVVYSLHNMLMCESCYQKEQAATTRAGELNKMLEASRTIDSSITLKTDIMLAKSAALIQLHSAIEHDENIPADEKKYRFVKECETRLVHLQKVIFDKRAELLNDENEARMLQANIQTLAAELRSDLRAQFKQYDVNYIPEPITKRQKSTKAVKQAPKLDKAALFAAAKKYDVPAAAIQSIVVTRGVSIEAAAVEMAKMMGKM